MATCEEQTFLSLEGESQHSPQESPASQQVWPGSERARATTVGSGRQCSMLLNQSSPLGAFSKILLGSSHWTSSEEYCYAWNRLDTKFALSAFQLTPLGPSTGGSGCLLLGTPDASYAPEPNGQKSSLKNTALWPTPDAGNFNSGEDPETYLARRRKLVEQGKCQGMGMNLSIAARLYPTPTVPNGGRRNPEVTSITGKKPDGGKAQIDLREFAIRLLSTPIASDWKSTSPANQSTNARPLREVMGETGSGSLNPRFVEQLMGFPIDHTDLKP